MDPVRVDGKANARNVSFFNPVVNTKLPAILSHRRSTTVSLETYPFKHVYESIRKENESLHS